MCRSVHAEQNAIISASRNEMIGSTLYLVGIEKEDLSLVLNAMPCALCKRMILNAGIEKVIARSSEIEFVEVNVSEWIENDDSLSGEFGY